MDKNCEGRRRGAIGSRHVSATRRSRTSGLKYLSACSDDRDGTVENNPSSRLQDSSNKHDCRASYSLQESDSCKETDSSQNKRKWSGSQEPQNHLPTMRTVEDMNDTSEDAGTARSEDDDDMPPPIVPHHHPWKLKLHRKPGEYLSPIDLAAVPRRLRTAMIKRHQESTTSPLVPDNPKQNPPDDVPAKLAATNSFLLTSNAALKPGRKTKLNSLKPPTAKLQKRSPTKVSKTEVEVAETLYDLSRMFMNQAMPSMPEAKAEPLLQVKQVAANAAAVSDRKPSLGRSTTAAALKKKRPRVSSKTKGEGQSVPDSLASVAEPSLLTHSLGAGTESANAEQAVFLKSEKVESQMEATANPPAGALVSHVIDSIADSPSTNLDKNPETLEEKVQGTEVNSPAPVEFSNTSVSAEKLTIANLVDSTNVDDKDGAIAENLGASETSATLEIRNRLLQLSPLEGAYCNKVEIDLMVPPKVSGKADNILDSNMDDGREKEEVAMPTIPAAEVILVGKEKNKEKLKKMDMDKENKQPLEMVEHDQGKDCKPEEDIVIFRERNNKREGLKDRGKQEVVRQTSKGVGKHVKADLGTQRVYRNASAALMMATTSSSLKSTPFPISVGMASWPAVFPSLGYYSPVAAAAAAAAVAASWPTPVPMIGMSSVENDAKPPQLHSPFLRTQQSRKRCATHVYITNFIDFQQQVKCNPLWAVAYGNRTSPYGARGYNLNNPMCLAASIFGNEAESSLMETSVSNAPGPGSLSCGLVFKEKDAQPEGTVLAAAKVHGIRDRPAGLCIDANPPPQQQTKAVQKKPTISLESGPALGFPVTQSPAGSLSGGGAGTSNTAGSNVLVTAAMFAGGSSASTNSSSVGDAVADGGSGLSDGGVANAAVVQAQILHSVIRQPTFPFSISPAYLGSTYSGHSLSQQASQFFGNPFYDPRMVSHQLANTSSASASQKQQQKHSQGVCSLPSLGPSQQHQQAWWSSQNTQYPDEAALQHPNHLNEKDVIAGIISSAKIALPIVDRNICGQKFPSVHVPSMNSQSLVLASVTPALPVHSQDFTQMPAFGGKQANKAKQQESQAQSQHQLTTPVQQLKQLLATQYHVASPALQIGLKGIGCNASHSISSINMNRESVSPDLLGVPAITSIMAPPPGQILQSIVDLARGHGHPQKSAHNQPFSGQSHQSSMPVGQDQQKQQQHHAQKQRAILNRVEETGICVNEGSHGNGSQPNISRPDLEASLNLQVSQTNGSPKITKNATSPLNLMVPSSQGGSSISVSISIPGHQPNQYYMQQMVQPKDAARLNLSAPAELTSFTFSDTILADAATFGKLPSGQRLPFKGQNEGASNREVRHGYTQELPQLKTPQKPSLGSPLPATSGTLPHDMVAAMAKNQRQQLDEPPVVNTVPVARISQAASLPSSAAATSLLPQPPVPMSGGVAIAKNSDSLEDCYSSQQKSSLAATSRKVSSPINVASILGPSPSKTLKAQMNQNQYSTHQNQQRQQHQRPAVLPQYASNQKQVDHLLQQTLPQQQHFQIGQHLLIQQLPQYEVQIQSQLHSQTMSQEPTLCQQNTSQKLQLPSRQMASKSPQLGSIQQQDLKHLQAVLPTSFGALTHTLGTVNATTAGVVTLAEPTGETNMSCPDSEISINARTALLHSQNGAASSEQQASTSNPLPQLMSNSGTVGKISEKTKSIMGN